MTSDELRRAADVMRAAADGARIEATASGPLNKARTLSLIPGAYLSCGWHNNNYRVAPAPSRRQWTPQEAVGKVLIHKLGGIVASITSAWHEGDGDRCTINHCDIFIANLENEWEQLDGSPVGEECEPRQ